MISPDQLRGDLSKVIRVAILVTVLLIFSGLANALPGVKTDIISGLTIYAAIKLGVAAVSIIIIGAVAGAVGTTVAYYANYVFGVYRNPVRAQVAPNVKQASGGVANLVVIALIWALVNQSLPTIQRIEVLWEFTWLPTAVTLVFILAVVLVLVSMYRSSGPIVDLISEALSSRAVAATQTKCSQCGTMNPTGVTFCASCGTQLVGLSTARGATQALRCTSCGTENDPTGKFCAKCGTPLPAPTPERGPDAGRPCPSCGAVLPEKAQFCLECGRALALPERARAVEIAVPDGAPSVESGGESAAATAVLDSPSPIPAEANAKPGAIACPNCSAQLPAGAAFCNKCGQAIKA